MVISEHLAFPCYVANLLGAGQNETGSLKRSQSLFDANINLKKKIPSRKGGGQSCITWVIQSCLHPDLQKIQPDPSITLRSTQGEEIMCKLQQPKQNRQREAQCTEQAGKADFADASWWRRNVHHFFFLIFFFLGCKWLRKKPLTNKKQHCWFYKTTPIFCSTGQHVFLHQPSCKAFLGSRVPRRTGSECPGRCTCAQAFWLWSKWVLKDDSEVLGALPREQINARCL